MRLDFLYGVHCGVSGYIVAHERKLWSNEFTCTLKFDLARNLTGSGLGRNEV